MAKPRAILKRRKSIQNIAKITKTMQMIARAKFKKTFDRAVAARPYTDRLTALVAELARAAGEDFTHPLLEEREDSGRVGLLAIASNRGLCGGYNSGVARLTVEALARQKAAGREVDLVVAGRRLGSYLRTSGHAIGTVHTIFDDKPTMAEVETAVMPLVEAYAAGKTSEVFVAYTRFESASRQFPVVERVLPFPVPALKPGEESVARDWIFDPSPAAILTDLIPRAVRLKFFQSFLDASVAEQVARMTAMTAATDNAQDMIVSLGRRFNRSRQAQITTELSEIMGGAAALE
jgi:F-type H+-transporting ATPase subunit gamma